MLFAALPSTFDVRRSPRGSLVDPPLCCYACVCGLAQRSYIIYRDEVEIASVGAGTLQFTNTNRTQGWPYSYRFDPLLLLYSFLTAVLMSSLH